MGPTSFVSRFFLEIRLPGIHPSWSFSCVNAGQGARGGGTSFHTLADPTIVGYQEDYVRKVVDTVNDLDNVLFEICNECNKNSTEWQDHMINFIKAYEATKPKQHPVGMTVTYPGGANDV